MSDLTLDELLTSYSADDLYLSSTSGNTGVFVDNLTALGLPADQWRPGSIASSVTRVMAIVYAMFSIVLVQIAKFGFLVTSSGGWLRLLARYYYGVEPIYATAATGQVTLTNSGGGVYSYAAGEFVVESADGTKTYKNLAPVAINPGDPPLTGINMIALQVGTVGNAAPGEISALAEPQTGLSVTNPASFVGLDDEDDPTLITRCLEALGARSVFGPLSAYKYAVSVAQLPAGGPVNVNRSRVSPFSSTGAVDVILASPSGPVTSDDITGVENSIATLSEVDTDTVVVLSASAHAITKALTVWAKKVTGLDQTTLTSEVNTSLISLNATWPIGGRRRLTDIEGKLFDDSIREAAKSADAAIWLVESDGIDTTLADDEVAVLTWTLDVRIVADS
jgi:hypothetical protein